MQRAFRGSVWILLSYGAQQAVRLASNLILTRLLFPEAFGLMAIVHVVVQGLVMLSDVGVTASILRSPRGDERAFLNTAWSIQALRGALLFGAALVMTPFAVAIYGQPAIGHLLPLAATMLLVQGLLPTNIETANRNLQLGWLSVIELLSQTLAVLLTILLAWIFREVWVLAVTGTLAMAFKLGLALRVLPGGYNRFAFERRAVHELVHFGKWLFLSTALGYISLQADKMILGRAIPIAEFGVYNIGYFLASFAPMAAHMIAGRILIPVYREHPPRDSAENRRKLRRARAALMGVFFPVLMFMGFCGVWLVGLLYTPAFALAGPVCAMLACAQMPVLIAMAYDQALVAAGDSRSLFLLGLWKAVALVIGLIAGLSLAGLPGALAGMIAANWSAYPLAAFLARRHGAWDALLDLCFILLAVLVSVLCLPRAWELISTLTGGLM